MKRSTGIALNESTGLDTPPRFGVVGSNPMFSAGRRHRGVTRTFVPLMDTGVVCGVWFHTRLCLEGNAPMLVAGGGDKAEIVGSSNIENK